MALLSWNLPFTHFILMILLFFYILMGIRQKYDGRMDLFFDTKAYIAWLQENS